MRARILFSSAIPKLFNSYDIKKKEEEENKTLSLTYHLAKSRCASLLLVKQKMFGCHYPPIQQA